jgi:hypothetical protein
MSFSRRTMFAVAASLAVGSAALAQTPASTPAAAPAMAPAASPAPAPTRVRGVISKIDAQEFQVTTRGGDTVTLKLADKVGVRWIEPIKVSAIKPGSFIGTAAVTQPDGTLKALEIQVFPESMRGVGEGHRPWDLGTGSTMTNGTVGDLKVSKGRMLTLTYKGGEQKVFVPAKAPVITYAPATKAALTKGAHVIVTAIHNADGTLTAAAVGVGKHGLVPPM